MNAKCERATPYIYIWASPSLVHCGGICLVALHEAWSIPSSAQQNGAFYVFMRIVGCELFISRHFWMFKALGFVFSYSSRPVGGRGIGISDKAKD